MNIDEIFVLADQAYQLTPISLWESEEMNTLFGENAKAHVRGMQRQDLVKMHLKLESLQCIPLTTEEFFTNIYADIDYCQPWGTTLHCSNPKCHAFSERVLASLHDEKLAALQMKPNFN